MSADNVILCLGTKSPNREGMEYRVAHVQAMENYDPNYDDGKYAEMVPCTWVIGFADSKVFPTKHDAEITAVKLYDEIGYTEYGLVIKEFPDIEFPTITVEEAEKIQQKWWDKNYPQI